MDRIFSDLLYILGILRDHTGHFTASVVMLDVATSLTVILWTAEYFYWTVRKSRWNK